MHTYIKTGTTSFANGFLLLVAVSGLLNVDLLECHPVSGHGDHNVPDRVALAFDAANRSVFPVLFISKVIPANDASEACIFRSHLRSTRLGVSSLAIQNTGPVNSRPLYTSHSHTRLFNIPHLNSDEDDAFVLPVDAA